jgi:hypothetical protein
MNYVLPVFVLDFGVGKITKPKKEITASLFLLRRNLFLLPGFSVLC